MTINVSTKKDGKVFDTLYFNQSENADLMTFSELCLTVTDVCVTCIGVLEGLVNYKNYKDAGWKPEGQKVTFKVYKSKKPEYDRDLRKYKDTEPTESEKHLYELLANRALSSSKFKGRISPWVNPMFFELIEQVQKVDDTQKTFLFSQCDKLNTQVVSLEVIPTLTLLAESDLKELADTSASAGEGNKKSYSGYSKPETEAEKLQARFLFLKEQLKSAFDFKDLYDYCLQRVYISHPVATEKEAMDLALTQVHVLILDLIGRE